MKVTVLTDNLDGDSLKGEWGLSHYIEYRDKVILLDTGLSGLFAENMFLKRGPHGYVPDDFRHEQSLIFELNDGIVVFNSCSHAGADNIVNEAIQAYPDRKIKAMVGGFHLFNKSDDYVRAFAHRLGNTGVETIYTGHCTGDRAMEILREELGSIVHGFRTGLVFEL